MLSTQPTPSHTLDVGTYHLGHRACSSCSVSLARKSWYWGPRHPARPVTAVMSNLNTTKSFLSPTNAKG